MAIARACAAAVALLVTVAPCRADTRQWEPAIAAFEADDRGRTDSVDAVLFVGSSSIRLWSTLAADMAPYAVVQRGFGGATTADVVHFADRLLGGREPPALVLYVGNDIQGDADRDASPEEAAERFRSFVEIVSAQTPRTTILIVAVTPSPSRWAAWPRIRELNERLAALCDATPNTMFVPTEDLFLGADGRPRTELFQDDRLHLAARGYAAWTRRIRSYLDPVMQAERRALATAAD